MIAEQGLKLYIQLTTLKIYHVKMVEAMELQINASRSPWMALPPY
jgi:hypothetical protein